jgi:DNA replication protein DnaC
MRNGARRKEIRMFLHPTLDKLKALKLDGMIAALDDQANLPECESLSFEERLGLVVDRELTLRDSKRLALRLAKASLRQEVAIEDLDLRTPRQLDRSQVLALSSCDWIRRRENGIVTGPTGVGKSFLVCALAQKACREGFEVLYRRTPRLFAELALGRADGSYVRKLSALARCDLLVLDDFGVAPFDEPARRDLLEMLDDRYGKRSTLVAAQVPVEQWHAVIGDPTLADAILDRLVHNAHKIQMEGESMRKLRGGLTAELVTHP